MKTTQQREKKKGGKTKEAGGSHVEPDNRGFGTNATMRPGEYGKRLRGGEPQKERRTEIWYRKD